MKILAFDPSMTNTAAVVEEEGVIMRHYLVKTQKSQIKKIRVGNDDLDRCRKIVEWMMKIVKDEKPDIIGTEMPTGSKSSRASKSAGMVIGMMTNFEDLLTVTPGDVKKALCNNIKASKEDMIQIAIDVTEIEFEDINKGVREHVADAVGVIYAVKKLDEYKIIERAINKNKEE